MSGKEYIEREALIDFCKKIIHDRWNETTAPVSWSHAYADFIDDINNQPAADVVPVKHGYWIKIGDYAFKCTSCGKMYWESKGYDARTHFCPNCGTRMDGNVKWR